MSWFYLALLVPIIYAVLNLIDDNLLHYVYEGPYMAASIAGVFGSLPLVSLAFLHTHTIPLRLASMAIAAGFLTALYLFFYFKALDVEQPSVVIALFGLVPATLPFLSHWFLNEQLTSLEITGFVVVLAASFLLALTDVKKFKFSAALVPVVSAVVLIDILSLLSKHVYDNTQFYPAYMYFSSGLGLGGIYFLLIMIFNKTVKQFKTLKGSLLKVIPILLVAEVTALAAEFTLNLAISRGPLSVVKVIEGTQPMFVLLIAMILYPLAPKLFREAAEKGKARKLFLMGVILIGLVLINIATKA